MCRYQKTKSMSSFFMDEKYTNTHTVGMIIFNARNFIIFIAFYLFLQILSMLMTIET